MQEWIEREIRLPGVSVFIGTSEWERAEDWVCPETHYVVCQRLSDGHLPLRLGTGQAGLREVYPRVCSLGFMPSSGRITLHPLGQPLRTLNCWFDRNYFEVVTGLDRAGWSDLAGEFMPVANRFVENLMHRICAEIMQPGFASEQLLEAAGTMIAVEMARLGQEAGGGAPGGRAQVSGLASWQLRRVRERIAASLEQGYPKTGELAELCGVSSSHLMRMFRISTGWSLHRFVAHDRLQTARRLLLEDGQNVKEVAARLGFSSAGHFTNAFRRHESMTPSEYRRRARASRSAPAGDGRLPGAARSASPLGLH